MRLTVGQTSQWDARLHRRRHLRWQSCKQSFKAGVHRGIASLLHAQRRVVHQRFCPEANTEDVGEGKVQKEHTASQPEMIADAADDGRQYGASHDSGGQDAGEGAVVFGNRIESQRDENGPHDRGKQADQREGNGRGAARGEDRDCESDESAG